MKKETNFQSFIISRFLVMLIYVVMTEFLVFFLMGYAYQFGMRRFPFLQLLISLILFIGPIIGAAYWFSKIIVKEVKRREDEEEALREQYERARNLMLSDIAHDLRTPITTIAGYSKALNDGMVTSEEKKKEYLEAIENKSERMSDLITLLFDYVRLDSDSFSLKRKEVDIAELIRENVALLYSDVEEKDMTIHVDIPDEVVKVDLDYLQFSRVITNLINNALKHNGPGTEIIIEMKVESNHLIILVSDNGNLIAPMVAEHIFEPFVVADASRESKGGSGLGLSIVKKIVEMHGGTIRLEQDYERHSKSFVIDMNK